VAQSDVDPQARGIIRSMAADEWDWSLKVFDHVDLNASDYCESVRFYETVLAPLGIPKIDEHEGGTSFTNLNIVDRRPPTRNLHLCFYPRGRAQVLYRDVGNVGHDAGPKFR
jgi:hypothetical protein